MTKTIIIAVNDPNILYLLQRYAEETGFQTVDASRGKDLLTLLAQKPDAALIILDAELSGITGRKMWHRLKAEAASRHIPVVVYSCQDDAAEEWHEGADHCLPKTVMYDDFVAALKRIGIC